MRRSSVLSVVPAVLAAGGLAWGQTPAEAERRFFEQQRLLDRQLKQQRMETAPLDSILDWQWGGWIDYFVFHYDDGIQSSRFVQRPSLAAWTRLRFDDGAHELFARVRLRYTWFERGDEIDRQQDWWGPNFDQAWYQIDVNKAFRLGTPADPLQLKSRIGRQTVLFGTGYTLDIPMDAVLLDTRIYDLRAQMLLGNTFSSYPNIDASEPVDSHSNRYFYGVQLSYEGWQRHVPFVYALWNHDRTDERPQDLFQEYNYDSFYLGFGARGELMPNLHYWAEGVFESGHSFGDGAFRKRDYIEAWGWDIGVEKRWTVPTRPRVMAEYMFASGDPDRLYSPTNAAGGNSGDRKDSSFVGFGFRDTGISAALLNSNLHVWKAGASLSPLERYELFRDLEIGTNWLLYCKHHSRAAISDPTADQFNGQVGWEMDYFLNWRLSSDLSWTVRWGTFFPGSAYSDRDCRHFIFSGVTWSF